MAEHRAIAARAWELSYLDPLASRELARGLAQAGGGAATEGWLLLALAEVRVGDAGVAAQALDQARQGHAERADLRGLALCDEVQAIALRRAGEHEASQRLHAEIDARGGFERDPMLRFIGHNSRAITHKHLGNQDDALRHFYASRDAAAETGLIGPQLTAISNLGGYHHNLFNLDDARSLSEQAMQGARAAGARQIVGNSAINLIAIYHAAGDPAQARAMAEFLLGHAAELLPGTLERARLHLALGHLGVGEIDDAERCLHAGAVAALGDGDGLALWTWLGTRCALARGEAALARQIAESTLREHAGRGLADSPYDLMELHRALADACEQLGDAPAALECVRRAHQLYEQLVGRSARARRVVLQVGFELARTQRERDNAVDSQRVVEADRQRLVELNLALGRQVAENESLQSQLREQALRDPLTGLHNRRYLFEAAPGAFELARRNDTALSVALLDLDHFKLLNDTYGHQAGDVVLQRFARLLADALRKSDIVCRHGGEEFVALLPGVDAKGAQAMLARLLETFQDAPPEPGRRRLPRCTFSAGIAQFPIHGSTLEQLLSRADRALYRAKQQGRSRIEHVPGTAFSALA